MDNVGFIIAGIIVLTLFIKYFEWKEKSEKGDSDESSDSIFNYPIDEEDDEIFQKIGKDIEKNELDSECYQIDTSKLITSLINVNELLYDKTQENYKTFSEKVITKIKLKDSQFSKENFFQWVKTVFILLYQSLANDKTNNLIQICTESFAKELKDNKIKEELNINKEIDIVSIQFIEFNRYQLLNESKEECVGVYITANLIDNMHQGNVVEDINSWNISYQLCWKRNIKGSGKNSDNKESSMKCPNCGASINIEDKQCQYCESYFYYPCSDWKLEKIEKID